MQPTMQTVLDAGNIKDFAHIDVVTCSKTLNNLFNFADNNPMPFRAVLEIVHNTVFFIRQENSPDYIVKRPEGYGHTMPKAFTTCPADFEDSQSHQRIIRYVFGELDILVRFEADGYLPNFCLDAEVNINDHQIDPPKVPKDVFTASGPTCGPSGPLKVKSSGYVVSQCSLFDLKTRSKKHRKGSVLKERLSRLWLTQVHNFIFARHDNGDFSDIVIDNVQEEIANWATQNQFSINKFAALLEHIVNYAKTSDRQRLELECDMDESRGFHIREVAEDACTLHGIPTTPFGPRQPTNRSPCQSSPSSGPSQA